MWIVVGLGNPGEKYGSTRHNLGFSFISRLVEKLDFPRGNLVFSMNKKLNAKLVKTDIYGDELILAKPQSFMNKSGEAVKKILDYFNEGSDKLIVVSDDSNLEIGKARVRKDGESGGHKGLESIISAIGPVFWRVRIGIGSPDRTALESYVLEKIPEVEKKLIEKTIDKVVEKMISYLSRGNIENITI